MSAAATSSLPVGDDAALMDAASQLIGLRALVDATEAHVLAELEARKATERQAGLTTASWWAREAGISVGAARKRVAVARRLAESLPAVDAALATGRLSWERAAVIAEETNDRNAQAMAASSEAVLGLSESTTFRRFATDVEALAREADHDGGYRPAEDPNSSRATMARHRDGSLSMRGHWFGDEAVMVGEALDRMTDELFECLERDRDQFPEVGVSPRPVLRAKAIAELFRLANGADPATSRAPIVEANIVIPAGSPLDEASARTVDGHKVQDGTVRLLGCDPAIRAIVVDTFGEPLDLGHTKRLFSAAQRAALAVRDGGCILPGCDAPPSWTDAHHHIAWDNGGPTDLSNGRLLCRRHHRLLHKRGWLLDVDHDGPACLAAWPVIESPTGERRWTQRHGRTPNEPVPGRASVPGRARGPTDN